MIFVKGGSGIAMKLGQSAVDFLITLAATREDSVGVKLSVSRNIKFF